MLNPDAIRLSADNDAIAAADRATSRHSIHARLVDSIQQRHALLTALAAARADAFREAAAVARTWKYGGCISVAGTLDRVAADLDRLALDQRAGAG